MATVADKGLAIPGARAYRLRTGARCEFVTDDTPLTSLDAADRAPYDFKAPIDPHAVARDPLLHDLIGTEAFLRLKQIRFLGGIDYLRVPAPNGKLGSRRYTRYQHSLGVARLALLYCDAKALPAAERRLVAAAGLLHDIGHAPLSHSLEPVFKQMFGIDHHAATAAIIAGRVPLGRDLHAALRAHGVDVERLIALVGGHDASHEGFFDGPINFDTIEGILRSQTYERPAPRIASPEAVTLAAMRRSDEADRILVDDFWLYKDLVYKFIINSEIGILADTLCQSVMRQTIERFSRDDYYTTEQALFRKLPGLRALLTSPTFRGEAERRLDVAIGYKARGFFVDPAGDFFGRQDKARYRQTRTEARIMPRRAGSDAVENVSRDLFDDAAGD